MRREVYIDDFRGDEDRPRRGRRDYHGRNDGFRHYDKGRGDHVLGGRRDGAGPHLDEGCNTVRNENPGQRFHRNRQYSYNNFNSISKTKMFSSKKDLVDYVNTVGETGQRVDIFKIEDDLYKVVTYGKAEVKE